MELKATYKSILKIAIPLILASFVSGIGQIIDTAFVNRIGEKELNGTVIAGMIWMFFSFILFGFSSYVQRLIAKKVGENENEGIGDVIDNVMLICVFLLLFVLVAFLALRAGGLSLMLKDPEIVKYSFEYLDILIVFLPFSICITFFSAFFSALGKTKVITQSVVVYIVVNLILDYVLIFGNFGFPKLDVFGSGIATGVALVFSCLNYMYYIKKYQFIKKYNVFKFKKINKTTISNITSKSIPLVLQNIFHMLAYWIFFIMIEKLGSAELRVSLIVRSLYLFLCLPVFGLGKAINTVVSNFIGREDFGNVSLAVKKSHEISLIVSLGLCAIVFFFPETLLSIYTNDVNVINDALPILRILLVSLLLFSISTVNTNIIIATGETKYVFIIGLISTIGYLFFAYVSIFLWNADVATVWYSDWINWGLFTVLSSMFFLSWKKRQIKVA